MDTLRGTRPRRKAGGEVEEGRRGLGEEEGRRMASWRAAGRKVGHVARELKEHVPFTLAGALLGVLFMAVFGGVTRGGGHKMFLVFHPLHVLLSAMVTGSLYKLHRPGAGFWRVLVITYIGSVGIATLSDSVIPYAGERAFGLDVPREAEAHAGAGEQESRRAGEGHGVGGLHVGFIEDWYVVNPAAAAGAALAFLWPWTKLPHAAHILVSTWASLAHILMNKAGALTLRTAGEAAVILFLAVWLPCCVSDIVFPSLFYRVQGGREEVFGR